MKSALTALIVLLSISLLPAADEGSWLVISPAKFHKSLKPLVEHREHQGFEVHLSGETIAKTLEDFEGSPDFLLLIGDNRNPDAPQAKTRQLYRWRATQAEDYVSDSAWGDRDGDGIPEVAVGRIPASTPQQLEEVVRKIIAFEEQAITADDLRMPVWAGNPNYGTHFEAAMASSLLRQTLQSKAPAWAETWVIIGNERDPLSGWAPDHPHLFNQQIAQGGLLNTMMGHGGADLFFSMNHQGGWVVYSNGHASLLKENQPAAPLVIFACDSGRFNHTSDSLAESLLFAPGGPVATIAATTESHPLTNYYSSISLLKHLGERTPRLGTLWTEAQRDAYGMKEFLIERMLAEIEGKLEAKLDTPSIRADHLMLYALLGDPATRLRMPLPLEVTLTKENDTWKWSVEKPEGGNELSISHRPTPKVFGTKADDTPAEESRKRFIEANENLSFSSLATLSADDTWKGETTEPGTLRFVVSGDQLHSQAVVLK